MDEPIEQGERGECSGIGGKRTEICPCCKHPFDWMDAVCCGQCDRIVCDSCINGYGTLFTICDVCLDFNDESYE